MSTPFVSSLRTSLGASSSSSSVASPAPGSIASKVAMASLFSSLDLALDASGAVVSNGHSAAKDLLASKTKEKQAEQQLAAAHALKKQQQQTQKNQKKEQPVTALSQALGLFDHELEQRESFVSRNTKRRQKGSKKSRGAATVPARGRRQRQEKYKRV